MSNTNELYISDLDGTLLNKNAEISKYSKDTLNDLIASGMNFSIATARTSATVLKIMSGVNFNVPIILMNGVLVYDVNNKKFIKKEILDKTIICDIVKIMRKHGQSALMYSIYDDEMLTYYENLDNKYLNDFCDERIRLYNKTFMQVDDFNSLGDKDIIYFTFLDIKERIDTLYEDIKNIKGLNFAVYKDNYSENLWYLECFNAKSSKHSAVLFLKKLMNYERITGFGDNLNDIPLFEACDECYAVENAKDELKAIATGIIESNDNDGVAKWLKRIKEHLDLHSL